MTSAPDVAEPATAATPVAPKHAPPRRRGWVIGSITAGIVLVLGGIGVAVVVSLQNTTYSPVAAITGYTDDIAAGRFADASAASRVDSGVETSVIDATQVELSAGITDVTFGEPVADGDSRIIPVSYEVDGEPGEGTVVVRSVGRELLFFDVWQIESGLETEAQVASTGLNEVLIGGVPVPLGETGATMAAYPGVYPVGGPESEWVTVVADPLVVTSAGGEATVSLSASDALAGEVETQVAASLADCEKSTSAEPVGCPFRVLAWNDVGKVTWNVTQNPTTELTGYESFAGTGGTVTARYTEAGVGARTSTQSFAVDGSIAIDGDTVTVEVDGY